MRSLKQWLLGDRQRAPREGRVQPDPFRQMIEHMQDAVMCLGRDGEVLYASRPTEKLFNCRRFELGGAGLVERIHVQDRPAFLTAFADSNVHGRARRTEIRMRYDEPDRSGAPKFLHVEISLSPLPRDEGEDGRHDVLVTMHDVTARHDREAELRQAVKRAEEDAAMRSRLLGTIGHELRTPLTSILGFSEMMMTGLAGDASPRAHEYASLIHQSGEHLAALSRTLLDLSRLEAGRFELRPEAFIPESLVGACLALTGAMAREKAIRLTSDTGRAPPMMVADQQVCRQILINLISNAIKFSPEGASVAVSMRRQGRYVAISVADQGIGMDEAAIRRIGQPFFRAESAREIADEGTGLGLSIVKGLVELHRGELHAASTRGEGTVMTVLLPINGPETKVEETESITPLHQEPAHPNMSTWPADERKRAL